MNAHEFKMNFEANPDALVSLRMPDGKVVQQLMPLREKPTLTPGTVILSIEITTPTGQTMKFTPNEPATISV